MTSAVNTLVWGEESAELGNLMIHSDKNFQIRMATRSSCRRSCGGTSTTRSTSTGSGSSASASSPSPSSSSSTPRSTWRSGVQFNRHLGFRDKFRASPQNSNHDYGQDKYGDFPSMSLNCIPGSGSRGDSRNEPHSTVCNSISPRRPYTQYGRDDSKFWNILVRPFICV